MRLVMIDNYDSFTFNLVQLFYEYGVDVRVFRHDEVTLEEIEDLTPDALCISPGPRNPTHAGISALVVKELGPRIPLLGVCLGMQVINEVFGGVTCKAPVCVHGKCSRVIHDGGALFEGVPSPFRAARYHSLCTEVRSPELRVTARTDDGVIMALEHVEHPIYGFQFHIESFMTEYGLEMAANFLEKARLPVAVPPMGPDRFPHARGDVHVFA